jgi:RNA polymerase sigma factor (sigma-70 family)
VSDSRSDAEIIRASLSDPGEFGEIYARHHPVVFRFVARRIGTNDAGDVAADVFVRAFSIRARYDLTKPDCLPWLYGIASNIVGDRFRRIRRRQRLYIAVVGIEGGAGISDADDRLVARQVTAPLNAALGELSRKDRETLLLFALEGLTYAEIGRVLGIPAGTVGSRITRARRRILELIPELEQIIRSEGPQEHEDGQ